MKIVWFSEIKWSYLKTRKQQIIGHFPEDWKVLFIESYVAGKPNHFLPRKAGRIIHVTVPFFKATPNRRINALQNNRLFRFLFHLMIFFWIKFLLLVTGFSGTGRIFCISNVHYINIVGFLKKKLLVYDCNDIPMGFSAKLEFTYPCFRKTIVRSDLTVTVSKKLAEKIRAAENTGVSLIGNGVDYDLFAEFAGALPAEFETIPAPRILYAGALADWFDADLVFRISDALPSSSVILIGPFLSPALRSKLNGSERKNVFILGEKRYQDLPAFYKAADVCIIPFVKNELTTGLNPNKLYEYLACGKPVVTRDFSDEIEELSGLIYVAKDDREFIDMIRRALTEKTDPEKLMAVARQNSWKSKSEQFVELILRTPEEKKQNKK